MWNCLSYSLLIQIIPHSKGGVEGEAVEDVWSSGSKCYLCFQVQNPFWRRKVDWFRFDLWFCWECKEVWTKVQANSGKLISFVSVCRGSWLWRVVSTGQCFCSWMTGDFYWSVLLFQNFLKRRAKSFIQLRAVIKATNSKHCITSLLHLRAGV